MYYTNDGDDWKNHFDSDRYRLVDVLRAVVCPCNYISKFSYEAVGQPSTEELVVRILYYIRSGGGTVDLKSVT